MLKPQTTCSRCRAVRENLLRAYCNKCHAAYMRAWRNNHPPYPTELARRRAIARAYANVYLRRGKLKKKRCYGCGSRKTQMHHEDYDKPLEVIWLCRRCHQMLHLHFGAGL